MRWIVLTLSHGAAIVSIIHGVFVMFSSSGAIQGAPAADAFTWYTGVFLLASAVLALLGGILALNRRRSGGISLVLAALICFFAHHDTLIYGGIYLVAGVLGFLVRSSSAYDDEDFDEEDEEDMEDDEGYRGGSPLGMSPERGREGIRAPSHSKRRERAAVRKNQEEYRWREDISKLNESVMPRRAKVCPNCNASVGVDHKFCYACGTLLNANSFRSMNVKSPIEEPESGFGLFDAPPDADGEPGSLVTEEPKADDFWGDRFQEREPLGEEDAEDGLEKEEDFEVLQPIPPLDGYGDDDGDDGQERISAPHRIFVKPQKEEAPVFRRSPIINPDDAYQEFSTYTRRRKKRRNVLWRRVVGPLVLLLAVGGAAWFLWGRTPPPNPTPPVSNPIIDPVPVPDPEPIRDPLQLLQILSPSRGVVVGSNVNVRPDHSTAGTAVMRLNANARVEVFEQWEGVSGNLSGPWYRIRANNREGWIYGQYLQPLDGRETTLPSGYTDALLKTFGSNRAELTAQLGQPAQQTATTLSWNGLTVNVRGDGEVTRLQLTSPARVLVNGTVVGLEEEALYRNMGCPSEYRSGQLRYIESGSGGDQGVVVRMQNGKVQNISVGNI